MRLDCLPTIFAADDSPTCTTEFFDYCMMAKMENGTLAPFSTFEELLEASEFPGCTCYTGSAATPPEGKIAFGNSKTQGRCFEVHVECTTLKKTSYFRWCRIQELQPCC